MRGDMHIVAIKTAVKDGIKFGRKDVVDENEEYQIW